MPRASRFDIALGATAARRKAIRQRPAWPDRDINISRTSLQIFMPTRATILSRNNTCGAQLHILAPRLHAIWRCIFRRWRRKRQMTETGNSRRREELSIKRECRIPTLWLALFVTARMPRELG